MTLVMQRALVYIKNTKGNATQPDFVEDHAPIGKWLWDDLHSAGLVRVGQNGKIRLTKKGNSNPR